MHCSLNELEDAALTFPVLFQDVIYQVNKKSQTFLFCFVGILAVCRCSQLVWRERSSSLAFCTCLVINCRCQIWWQEILYSLKLFHFEPKSCVGIRERQNPPGWGLLWLNNSLQGMVSLCVQLCAGGWLSLLKRRNNWKPFFLITSDPPRLR